jgi:PelA/Pel-15E family pectate lyase
LFRKILPCAVVIVTCSLPLLGAPEKPRSWPPNQFLPLTQERIAALPVAEQTPWKTYLEASQVLSGKLPAHRAPDFSPLQPIPGPPKGGQHTKGLRLDAPIAWYAGDEARTIADRVVEWQTGAGAWRKGIDYTKPRGDVSPKDDVWDNGTFDNDATIFELRFLALVNAAAGDSPKGQSWRNAFLRGLHFCFSAQYPNGGYPQVYPLVGGYHDNITYNDSAMTHVLELFLDLSTNKSEYAFVSSEDRTEAAARLDRGIRCVLATQLKGANGRGTAWGQQYDALTMQPAAARNFEPVSLCTSESADLMETLMKLPKPSPDVIRAVDDAVVWFRQVTVKDTLWHTKIEGGRPVHSPGAPALWSRLYEIGTDKPIFGDRDRTIHYAVEELSPERREGYGWYGTWPQTMLNDYTEWRKKQSP